jgi:hypothetical protein
LHKIFKGNFLDKIARLMEANPEKKRFIGKKKCDTLSLTGWKQSVLPRQGLE